MIFGSVCSGIEAASVAWHPLGWRAAFLSEIEPFPRAVLKHRWPDNPLHGDFTTINEGDYEPIELLVGGTPCQSFSVAGLRGGLADDRGNLALEFLRLAQRLRPRWLVWENVPGVFSSLSHPAPDPCPPPPPMDMGRDGQELETEDEYDSEELHAFNCFLAGLSELGYGFAYRVLDAQFAGVPQRRRRPFVVGYLGGWRRAAAVLFERYSLSGNPPPRREAGEGTTYDVAPCIGASGRGFERAGDTRGQDCLIAHSLRGDGFDASEDGTGRGTPLVPVRCFDARQSDVIQYGDRSGPLDTDGHSLAIAFDTTQITHRENRSNPQPGDPSPTLAKGGHAPAVAFSCKDHGADAGNTAPTLRAMGHDGSHPNAGGQVAVAFDMRGRDGGAMPEGPHDTANIRAANGGSSRSYVATEWAVRRLTPRECERLQGFPDDYTLVPYRGKPAADGPRYKALGNSMAVPCMRWIGERIAAVDALEVGE